MSSVDTKAAEETVKLKIPVGLAASQMELVKSIEHVQNIGVEISSKVREMITWSEIVQEQANNLNKKQLDFSIVDNLQETETETD